MASASASARLGGERRGNGATMVEATSSEAEGARRRGVVKSLGAGLALAALLGAGGFHATSSGLVTLVLPAFGTGGWKDPSPPPGGASSFVPLDTLTVTVGLGADTRLLRISATIETVPGAEEHLRNLMPRVLDVLASYLHSLRDEDLSRPAVMARLRAHLLRRVRIVVGEDAVRDLLITEFVLQ